MKKCVVLGGNGFIGRHVCAVLVRDGFDVISLVRKVIDHPAYPKQQYAVDLQNAEETSRYFVGAENIICLAPSSLPATANENISADVHSHVEATIRLAEYAANLNVAKFVFASSGGTVYGDNPQDILTEQSATCPISAYGASKLAIEHYLSVLERHSNTSVVSLRIANPYGRGQDIRKEQGFMSAVLHAYRSNTPITIWGDGEIFRDFLDVSDVASAMRLALAYEGPHSVFNIGSSQGYSLNEVIAAFEEVAKTRIEVTYKPNRHFDVYSNILCNDLAKAELGWVPKVTLKKGIYSLLNELSAEYQTAA